MLEAEVVETAEVMVVGVVVVVDLVVVEEAEVDVVDLVDLVDLVVVEEAEVDVVDLVDLVDLVDSVEAIQCRYKKAKMTGTSSLDWLMLGKVQQTLFAQPLFVNTQSGCHH